jgi:hypothetical protein
MELAPEALSFRYGVRYEEWKPCPLGTVFAMRSGSPWA